MPRAENENTTPTPAADPLIAIGREIYRLRERALECELMAYAGRGGMEGIYSDVEMDDLHDRISCLRAYATTLQSTSLEGALVQISVAFSLFSDVAGSPLPECEIKDIERRFGRCMYSAIRAISGAAPNDVSSVELGVYVQMQEHLNPWEPWESLVAKLRAEHLADRMHAEELRAAGRL